MRIRTPWVTLTHFFCSDILKAKGSHLRGEYAVTASQLWLHRNYRLLPRTNGVHTAPYSLEKRPGTESTTYVMYFGPSVTAS